MTFGNARLSYPGKMMDFNYTHNQTTTNNKTVGGYGGLD